MGMSKHTPGPWKAAPTAFGPIDIVIPDGKDIVTVYGGGTGNKEANARLIASAPDHAMIGWAMCVAAGRWEPAGDLTGAFCINGICHHTKLDEFGCPAMTDALRSAIRSAGYPS